MRLVWISLLRREPLRRDWEGEPKNSLHWRRHKTHKDTEVS